MKYISTRGGMAPAPYSAILLEGLATDGGLVVPETVPQLTAERIEALRGLSYAELATEILSLYATDIPRADLAQMCAAAYSSENFVAEEIVPLTAIDEQISLVGLSEGPTLAFKDMAMQFLGQSLEYVLARSDRALNIIGATSGDTGSAAEYALRGKEGIAVFMLSPQGRMSDFQRAQMYSLTDANIHNIAVAGVFDDCQNLVKELSGDLEFKRAHELGTVNSINLGRISAQMVYYFWAWLRATDAVAADERAAFEVSFTVPSGNFGNILSGHMARAMGLPIRRLVLAANENNVLDQFFRTGIYEPRGAAETYATSSPSMDISKASNIERFIFDLLGRDTARLAAAWEELAETGRIDLTQELPRLDTEFGFQSGTSTHADRVATIRDVHASSGIIIDPHTADGVKVAREHVEPGIPMLVLETAKPEKFPDIVREATGIELGMPEHLADLLELPQHVTEMGNDAAALRAFIAERAVQA
ncbi:threonine synthase [Leucobacter chromiireducens]|uniref:Threonine synthase n=1 Tax=Leucobacter chromiireducens subsp. chromiireducens TaxID=660067 RepID=A0ABS1SPG1_9MICO|nr:threonine synthase [Leucobacter chromiireducens]MBL3690041.1 threonine synthase [Leucobacter chromiireducens subsp. chromiireducens]